MNNQTRRFISKSITTDLNKKRSKNMYNQNTSHI